MEIAAGPARLCCTWQPTSMCCARTVALANTKRLAEAEAERELFLAARDALPGSRMLFNNTCRDILVIAEQMMMGELEYHDATKTKLQTQGA